MYDHDMLWSALTPSISDDVCLEEDYSNPCCCILSCLGATDLPSISDDTGLDEDLDSSDVGSRTATVSSADTSAFGSEFDSTSQTDSLTVQVNWEIRHFNTGETLDGN